MTWTHIGSIELYAPEVDNADAYACVTRVIGDVSVSGFSQNDLGGLRNLVSIEGSLYVGGEKITDLSAFECLEEASIGLQIAYADNLLNPSGMSRLRSTGGFRMNGTGATVMPTFAPGFTVDGNIEVEDNPALKNLDAMADWKGTGATGVYIRNNTSLASIEGLKSVLPSTQVASVQLHNLPALSSIAGLDGVSEFLQLSLTSLPLVEDLMPLAQVEHVNGLLLNDMPKITDMQGLNQLETVDYLVIGGCWTAPLIGNMGLQSLEGLSSLTTVGRLGIGWNPNLGTLAGADKLTTVEVRWNAEFNALDEADLAAFAAQVGMERCDFDFDRECSCFN